MVYRLETKITEDGKIFLPPSLKRVFNHRVEVTLKEKPQKPAKKKLEIPSFSCGGKLKNFSRKELYDNKL